MAPARIAPFTLTVRSTVGALALTALLACHTARAQAESPASITAPASGHTAMDAHQHHHHHPVTSGVERSMASYAVPDVTLIDQRGQQVPLRELLASPQPVLLNFFYTSCTAICPVTSATFAQVQAALGSDRDRVRMVSVSIDPEHDSPQELAAYAERFQAGPQWLFLTGSLEDSIAVQQAFDAYRGDKMNHTPLTLMRPRPDAQWLRYDGFASAAELARECCPGSPSDGEATER